MPFANVFTRGEGRFLNSVTSDRYPRSPGYDRFRLYTTASTEAEAAPFLFVDRGSMIVCVDSDGRVVLKDSVTRRSKQYLELCVTRRGTGDPPQNAHNQRKIIVCPFACIPVFLLDSRPNRHIAPKANTRGSQF